MKCTKTPTLQPNDRNYTPRRRIKEETPIFRKEKETLQRKVSVPNPDCNETAAVFKENKQYCQKKHQGFEITMMKCTKKPKFQPNERVKGTHLRSANKETPKFQKDKRNIVEKS